ncbi:hypothetical protein AXG93_4542s1160 [Marchantia polymorpha subsp. ruderalis]|uniref:Uncharacterized protein n=1 Tax=Marchantia polymorpha subsp. ruderalis TaxID=1480154 RepID=A0A176W281_MARPO|nr:hypothetical protein AXG93_4542s1160 [Marchantia polymorpha subsp. ruderalis]
MAGIAQVFLTLNERLERLVTRVDHLFVQSESRKGDPGRDAQALALSKQNLAGLARRIDLIEEQHKKLQDSVDKLIAVCEGMEKKKNPARTPSVCMVFEDGMFKAYPSNLIRLDCRMKALL